MSVTGTVRKLGRFRLGARIVVACLILVCSPMVVAWLMGVYDRVVIHRVHAELEQVGRTLAREWPAPKTGPLDEAAREWLRDFGKRHDVFIRVLGSDGRVEEATEPRFGDGRANRTWWFARSADLFFGPEGPPDLIAFEASVGPEEERNEVVEAMRTRESTATYRAGERGHMFVFHRTVPVEGGRILYLARVSRRSARALYDLRFQLLKLTLALAVGALLMGAWLAWGVVGPIRKLQRRVRTALATGVGEPLALTRRDEIGQLSRDFDRLTRRLSDRLEHSANVAEDFAHDLKNPIAAVVASAELLEGEAPTPERTARIARAVRGAGEHLKRSVDAMLDLARVDEALQKEPRTEVDLSKIVESVVRSARDDLRNDDLTIVTSGESVWVLGNGPRLAALVENLVANALVFAKSKVEVRVAPTEAGARISVADDGPGVSAGNRDKIFGRFFTSRPENADPGGGLGLSIVDTIAKAHGGRVVIADESPLGGACFVVELSR